MQWYHCISLATWHRVDPSTGCSSPSQQRVHAHALQSYSESGAYQAAIAEIRAGLDGNVPAYLKTGKEPEPVVNTPLPSLPAATIPGSWGGDMYAMP